MQRDSRNEENGLGEGGGGKISTQEKATRLISINPLALELDI